MTGHDLATPLMPDPVTSAQLHTLWALPEQRLDATSAPGTRAEAPHEELALTSAELAELFARIVWSRITEPGDATAGTLIAWLGAPTALALVARGAHPREFNERFLRTEAPLGSAAAGEPPSGPAITAALRRWRPRIADTPASSDIERAVELGMRVVTPTHPAWPQQLNDLGAHTPHLLWVLGNPTHLSAPSLAIVGARACTSYGAHVTAELAAAAVAGGRVIVSGAAYGVDAVAHRTALAAERPTVAVLAGGADRVYPAAHDTLLARVREQGVVCSELVPGAAPTRWRFLQRNRLIAALADATLVTEAGPRSGSLNTAGHAATLGRPLGAVPGPITSAASAGCHRLVQEYGAALITGERDLTELIEAGGGEWSLTQTETHAAADDSEPRQPETHRRVLDALPLRGSRTAERLAQLAGLDPREAQRALVELELLGSAVRRETPGDAPPRWALQRRQ